MIIKSDTRGMDQLIARIRQVESKLPAVTLRAAERIGEKARETLSNAAPKGKTGGNPPPGDQSGTLANSFTAKAEQSGNGARMTLETKQPLKLQYVTRGTGVYAGKGRIRPTMKKALYWKGADHPVKSVKGMKGRDFVKPIMKKRGQIVRAEMEKAASELRDML